jgi:hypothetical protein
MLLQVAAYGYFFTTVVFTNHTIPNVWQYAYPSFKTVGEGRWMADLIIQAQGGSGVQSFQMILATALQAFNGILLARTVGARGKLATFGLAAVLCLYPAFLDYYSFSIDHLTFVLGDTFALLGARALLGPGGAARRAGAAALLFLLAIAAYQPKIAMVGLMAATALLLRDAGPGATESGDRPPRGLLGDLLAATVAVAAAVALYWLSAKVSIRTDLGLRTHLNRLPEAVREVGRAYPRAIDYFTGGATGLPRALRALPAVGLLLGIGVALQRARRAGAASLLAAALVVGALPPVLYASYVVNDQSWEGAGRILAANGYALVLFLGVGLQARWVRGGSAAIAAVCLYFFLVLATQESNAAAFKTIYDLGYIGRIASRAELVLGPPDPTRRALVVVGHYPEFGRTAYGRNLPGGPVAHVSTPAFECYRQTGILNFVLGREAFRSPTKAEVERALDSARGRPTWPASEAVYRLDDSVVVLLETYRPGVSLTWTSD